MTEHYDDQTLEKVRSELYKTGLSSQAITDVIAGMQNSGILFRVRGQGVAWIEGYTTRELLAELERRMAEWPGEMWAARAVIRGTVKATEDAAQRMPMIQEILDGRRT